MKIRDYRFGSVVIDGKRYVEDVVILSNGNVRRRPKGLSQGYGGHTPLGPEEIESISKMDSPQKLVVGTGMYGVMPVLDDAKRLAEEKGIEIFCEETGKAIERFLDMCEEKNVAAILHLTC